MRLLIHVAGEADLLLDSHGQRDPHLRAARVQARIDQINAAAAGPDGPAAVRNLLTGAWREDYPSTPPPSPLPGILSTMDHTRDLDILVIGTGQNPPHPLDTLPIAQTIASAITLTTTVHSATAVAVPDLLETPVVAALTGHLNRPADYHHALVTWGSGATALTMGALTTLSRAGLPWHLITTTGPAQYQTIDPLQRLDTDPVIGVLVRWRMFTSLDQLASPPRPLIHLTPAQHNLIHRAAQRHRAGFEARDATALRCLLADAAVRRDATASLAVRRYITSRYEELLDTDRHTHPHAKDLLRHVAARPGGRTLGALLGKIREGRTNDPAIRASQPLPSFRWLFSDEVDALQAIGKGSHNLRPPTPGHAQTIGSYLTRYDVDGTGWGDAHLPEPPVNPADTVLAVWLAGPRTDPQIHTIGQQLINPGPPAALRDHVGVQDIHIRSVIFGVPGEHGSLHHAEDDAARLHTAGQQAWPHPVDLTNPDPQTIHHAIESRLTRETAALLLIPTGHKRILLPLLQAMRRIGAQHGIPLFVRQTADPAPGTTHTQVYHWPALAGGDLPLLVAAREALRILELDVAWRLLAASAIEPDTTDGVRRLAAAFASRRPLTDANWPHPDPAPTPDLAGRTLRMIAQRLALVTETLTQSSNPTDRIRLLVLAADSMEASIAATQRPGTPPGTAYRQFRDTLDRVARHRDSTAHRARILLLLNDARDRAPITHGATPDPDAAVARAAKNLARTWSLTPDEAATLPHNVVGLLHMAVAAATAAGLGRPDTPGNLVAMHQQLEGNVARAIFQRGRRNAPSVPLQ